MFFQFSYAYEVGGVHVATFDGTARIEQRDGHLQITLIRLDGMRKGVAEIRRDSSPLRDAWLFADIALWLHQTHYSDIAAEWREHCARQGKPGKAAA